MSRARQWRAIGAAFLSHYQRHPLQLLGLILIIAVATALWTSVHVLTSQARDSFTRSQASIEPITQVLRKDGTPVTRDDFGLLRRAGVCVTPRLTVTLPGELSLRLVGIDPLSAPCANASASAVTAAISMSDLLEPTLWGNKKTLKHWRETFVSPGDIRLQSEPSVPAQTLIGDIAVVARFTEDGTARLQLLTGTRKFAGLPQEYRAALVDYGIASDELADSFLLNLDALAVLVVLVAALLIRSVNVFGLRQRQETLAVLEQAGVTRQTTTAILAIELFVIGTVGATLGLMAGTGLATVFSGGLRATLAGLFDANVAEFTPPGTGLWAGAVLLIVAVMVWTSADLLRLDRPARALRHRLAHALSHRLQHRSLFPGAVLPTLMLIVLLCGSVLIAWAPTLWLLYIGIAVVLGVMAFLLPRLIIRMLQFFEARARAPLDEWSATEMQALARAMAAPLTALAFAMAAAVGVHSMVTSFETTFSAWLNQRLQGDLFLTPENAPSGPLDQELDAWGAALAMVPAISRAHPRVTGRGLARGTPVDIVLVDGAALPNRWSAIRAQASARHSLETGDSAAINEQLARRSGLTIGDRIALQVGSVSLKPRIVAIYADYGRPAGEVLLTFDQLGGRLMELPQPTLSYSLETADPEAAVSALERARLPAAYALRSQAEIRQLANAAFARTFRLTEALVSLTLLLAALCLALIGLTTFRIRQPVYALLQVYGLTRRQVRTRLLSHAIGLALLLSTLALPVGVFLSWLLVARVNPLAFGWALPFEVFPGFWLQLIGTAVLVGGLMGWGLGRTLIRGPRPLFVLLPLLVALSGCGPTDSAGDPPGFAALGSKDEGYLQPRPGMAVSLPDDMGAHPGYRLEWWYLTANLTSEDGRRFGAQWTLFRQSLAPPLQDAPQNHSGWDSPALWMAHAALSGGDYHYFAEKLARGGTSQAGAETDPVRLWLDDWRLEETRSGVFNVIAGAEDFSYRLEVRRTRPLVRHGIDGFSAKSPEGQGSMYFSFVGLDVTGQIRRGDDTVRVSGKAWLDREWSSQLLGRNQQGWDWFSMHLGNGAKLMVFQLRGDPVFYSGTLVQPNGDVIALRPEQIKLKSTKTISTAEGAVPVEWTIQIPDYALDLTVASWPGEYWNVGLVPYWEGPITVTGSHSGEGFLEMTGYYDDPAD